MNATSFVRRGALRGLGLTITRHIIEAQGGRIWAESEYGTGTAFRFTLPLALPEPHEPEEPAEMRSEPAIARGDTNLP